MDKAAITAALKSLRDERARIEEGIIVLERLLREVPSGRGAGRPAAGEGPKRQISAAARRKMAAAQKRRWAAYRAAQKASSGSAATKKAAAKQ